MAIRAKTKRRLFILLGSVAVVVALGATIYTVRMGQIRQNVLKAREAGFAAMSEGDHFTAMHQFGRYLQHHTSDADVTYQYAKARLAVEEPDGRHMVDGARSLRRAMELNPDNPTVRRELLGVYGQIGFNNEALDLARRMLADDPEDAEALRAQFTALVRLRMYDEADALAQSYLERDEQGEYLRSEAVVLEALRGQAIALHQQSRYASALPVAEAFNAQRPDDYQMQRLTLELMHELDQPAQQRRTYARTLREDYPDHPGFAVLEARTLRRLGNPSGAREAMTDAVTSDLSQADDDVVMDVLNELDRQQMFSQTVEVMQRVASQMEGLRFRQVMAHRLAMVEQWDVLLSHFGALAETLEQADSTLLAMVALARFQQDEHDKAEPILTELRSRVNDAAAMEWSTVLTAVYGEAPASPRAVIDAVRRASEGGSGNPFFQNWLARAYREVGEGELAIRAWQRAAQAAPSWNTPLLESAQLLSQIGRPREAVGVAQLALQRSPNDLRAGLMLAEAVWQEWDSLNAQQAGELRRLLDRIQEAAPFEPRSLVLQVRVHAASGDQAAARARVAEALEADAGLPIASQLALAEVMASIDEPEMEQRLLNEVEMAEGASDGSAMRDVQAMVERGEGNEAMAIIAEQLAAAEGEQQRAWRLWEARLLEQLGDGRAMSAWRELLTDYPQDMRIHRRALDSQAAWQDRELIATAIDRVREMAGDEALSWRVARARWLLEGPADQRQNSEIADLLQSVIDASSQHVQARLLMARYHEQTGSVSSAISQLTRVVQQQPDRSEIRLHLARMLQQRGDTTQARLHMEAVSRRSGQMAPAERLRAVSAYLQQGELERAIDLLEPYPGESAQQDMTLAELYARAGRVAEAGQLYDRLLEEPTGQQVEHATRFFAATGEPERAAAALARLEALELEPGRANLIRGNYYAAVGEVSQAHEAYRRASEAAPENAMIWRRRAAYAITQGEVETALSLLNAAANATDDAWLRELAAARETLRAATEHDAARPILIALLSNPANHQMAMQAVTVLADVDTPADGLPALQSLAEQHPRFMALQSLVYRLHFAQGSHEQAVALARQMVHAMPGASEPAWMLAEALSAAGEWEEAMQVAQQSAAQGGVAVAQADQLIAEARLNLGDSAAALRQIEPYLEEALAEPDEYAPLIVRGARAMIQTGDVGRAEQMLEPMLERSARWRSIWLQLAVAALADPADKTRWLKRLEQAIPANERAQRFQLAQAWWGLHDRTDSGEHREDVRRVLTGLTQLDPPMAEAVMGLAVLEDAAGNREAAEQGYREALAMSANLSIAANNLAVILYERGDDVDEAVSFARKAVEVAPDHAPFRHTLAQALETRGDATEALEQMRKAVELDEANPRWHVALAMLLVNQEQFDAAGDVLASIDEQFPQLEDVPDEVREDLESVRSQWKERQRSSAVPR